MALTVPCLVYIMAIAPFFLFTRQRQSSAPATENGSQQYGHATTALASEADQS